MGYFCRYKYTKMIRIGLISDTHGCFDASLQNFLASVDQIWHAGDIGQLETADAIRAFKPLIAVHGNIDDWPTRSVYPQWQRFSCEGVDVLMTHICGYPNRYDPAVRAMLQQKAPGIVIGGHSHILKVIYDKRFNCLHLNPGAAGISGFHSLRTALRFEIHGTEIKNMEIWEFPKKIS